MRMKRYVFLAVALLVALVASVPALAVTGGGVTPMAPCGLTITNKAYNLPYGSTTVLEGPFCAQSSVSLHANAAAGQFWVRLYYLDSNGAKITVDGTVKSVNSSNGWNASWNVSSVPATTFYLEGWSGTGQPQTVYLNITAN
jgi:hypothetical protein